MTKFWNSSLEMAKPGDIIVCKGIRATIAEIYDQYNDPAENTEYYGIEFKDTEGHNRYWKQRWEGGTLIPASTKVDDKPTIVKKLEELLKMTRAFEDLDYCKYEINEHGNEYVIVVGKPNKTGYRWKYSICVTWDSGIALIRDVLKQIG